MNLTESRLGLQVVLVMILLIYLPVVVAVSTVRALVLMLGIVIVLIDFIGLLLTKIFVNILIEKKRAEKEIVREVNQFKSKRADLLTV